MARRASRRAHHGGRRHGGRDDDEPHAFPVQMEEPERAVELHEQLVDGLLVHVAHPDQAVRGGPREDRGARPARQLELPLDHRRAAHLGAGDQEHRGQQGAHGRPSPDVWRSVAVTRRALVPGRR